MLLRNIVISYAYLFEISTIEADNLIKPFLKEIEKRYFDTEIILLEKEEENVIFVLENQIKVKFSPHDTIPIIIVPPRYSANEVVYNFQLCTHLGNNRELFTGENMGLLRKLECKNKTSQEITELHISIADAFKIPKSERQKLWSLVSGILPLIMRIKAIEKQGIVIGTKVVLEKDKKEFREVYQIAPNFYLKVRGINEGVDPLKVRVL